MANFFLDNKDLQYHLEHPLMRKIVELKERGFAEKDTYDYAPQNFEDAMDSYRKVLEIAGEVCGDVIAPNAESVDHEGPKVVNDHVVYAEGTQRNLDAVVKAGLSGLTLPREYDGLNFPLLCFVMTNEMVARADAGFENIWGLQDCAETLNEFASEELKQKYLPWVSAGATCAMDLTEPDAGSDLGAVMLKATWSEQKGTWLPERREAFHHQRRRRRIAGAGSYRGGYDRRPRPVDARLRQARRRREGAPHREQARNQGLAHVRAGLHQRSGPFGRRP